MTCPQCSGPMEEFSHGFVTVRRCADCSGVFLGRAELGALIEAENDWHAHQSTNTATLPRITADMTEAPAMPARSRAFVETLFSL